MVYTREPGTLYRRMQLEQRYPGSMNKVPVHCRIGTGHADALPCTGDSTQFIPRFCMGGTEATAHPIRTVLSLDCHQVPEVLPNCSGRVVRSAGRGVGSVLEVT